MTDNPPRQLAKLARPIPDTLVSQRVVGGGRSADYVGHAAITELLLMIVGPFDLRLVDVVRDANGGAVVGAVVELSVTIDGRPTVVQEIGEVEEKQKRDTGEDVTGHDGARLKLAMSDGLKRAAMRIGLATELWSRNGGWLFDTIVRQAKGDGGQPAPTPQPVDDDRPDPDGEQ